jgi:opacity protein-like surface antigen
MFFTQKQIKLLACAASLGLASFANAEGFSFMDKQNFVIVKGGYNKPTNLNSDFSASKVDEAFAGGFEVGRKFKDRFAGSLEYAYRSKSDAKTYPSSEDSLAWSVKSHTFMANLSAYLFTEEDKVNPYVKAGLGFSRNKVGDYIKSNDSDDIHSVLTYPGKDETKFAWQIGAGVSLPFIKSVDTQLEYMFIDRGKVSTESKYMPNVDNAGYISNTAKTGHVKDHVFTVGFKLKF